MSYTAFCFMPLPTPHRDKTGKKTEKKSEFISRCAGDTTMNKDFPDTKQRLGVCFSQWEKRKAKAAYVISAGGEEFATFIDDSATDTPAS